MPANRLRTKTGEQMEHEKLKEIFNQYKHNYLLDGHKTATPLMDFNNFKYAAWCIENSSPVEAGVMQKPAGSADEIFIKGKIEGLEEARWQINYALPHIDPNGRLEKQTKYLMDAFKEVQDELKAKL